MKGWNVSLGAVTSLGLHVAATLALSRPVVPDAPAKKPTVVELAVLPPAPEVPPPAPQQVPEPVPVRPQTFRHDVAKSQSSRPEPRTPQSNAQNATLNVSPDPAIAPTPLVLAGLTLSNDGVGVPSGFGLTETAKVVGSREPMVALPKVTPEGSLTPVSDLSQKPVPPALGAALARHYPSSLRQRGIEGEGLIRVVLAKDGRVSQTQPVSESHPGFATACEKALRGSQWAPPIDKSGNPTRTALKYRCRFKVNL